MTKSRTALCDLMRKIGRYTRTVFSWKKISLVCEKFSICSSKYIFRDSFRRFVIYICLKWQKKLYVEKNVFLEIFNKSQLPCGLFSPSDLWKKTIPLHFQLVWVSVQHAKYQGGLMNLQENTFLRRVPALNKGN